MERKEMEEFVASAALLAGHLTRQCEQAIADQRDAVDALRRSAADVGTNVADGQAALSRQTSAAVRDALAQEIPAASAALADTAARLQQMADQLQQQRIATEARLRFMGWKSIVVLGAAAALVVVGTAYVARHNLERADRARVDAAVLDALEQVSITSCDGQPCIKLEPGLQRWSRNEEYVLVERTGSSAPAE